MTTEILRSAWGGGPPRDESPDKSPDPKQEPATGSLEKYEAAFAPLASLAKLARPAASPQPSPRPAGESFGSSPAVPEAPPQPLDKANPPPAEETAPPDPHLSSPEGQADSCAAPSEQPRGPCDASHGSLAASAGSAASRAGEGPHPSEGSDNRQPLSSPFQRAEQRSVRQEILTSLELQENEPPEEALARGRELLRSGVLVPAQPQRASDQESGADNPMLPRPKSPAGAGTPARYWDRTWARKRGQGSAAPPARGEEEAEVLGEGEQGLPAQATEQGSLPPEGSPRGSPAGSDLLLGLAPSAGPAGDPASSTPASPIGAYYPEIRTPASSEHGEGCYQPLMYHHGSGSPTAIRRSPTKRLPSFYLTELFGAKALSRAASSPCESAASTPRPREAAGGLPLPRPASLSSHGSSTSLPDAASPIVASAWGPGHGGPQPSPQHNESPRLSPQRSGGPQPSPQRSASPPSPLGPQRAPHLMLVSLGPWLRSKPPSAAAEESPFLASLHLPTLTPHPSPLGRCRPLERQITPTLFCRSETAPQPLQPGPPAGEEEAPGLGAKSASDTAIAALRQSAAAAAAEAVVVHEALGAAVPGLPHGPCDAPLQRAHSAQPVEEQAAHEADLSPGAAPEPQQKPRPPQITLPPYPHQPTVHQAPWVQAQSPAPGHELHYLPGPSSLYCYDYGRHSSSWPASLQAHAGAPLQQPEPQAAPCPGGSCSRSPTPGHPAASPDRATPPGSPLPPHEPAHSPQSSISSCSTWPPWAAQTSPRGQASPRISSAGGSPSTAASTARSPHRTPRQQPAGGAAPSPGRAERRAAAWEAQGGQKRQVWRQGQACAAADKAQELCQLLPAVEVVEPRCAPAPAWLPEDPWGLAGAPGLQEPSPEGGPVAECASAQVV